jgi:glycosyltransferase involved in cell wall biosynthesis
MYQDAKDCELEIIVVDDGSTDNTREAVTSFGGSVKYIFQENQGAGAARNRGVKESSGEWLAFLDSDDRWLPDKLSLQFKVLEAFPEYNAAHSNFYTFEGDRILISKGLEYWVTATKGGSRVDWSEFYDRHYNSYDYGITHCGLPFEIYSGNVFSAFLKAPCAACWTLLIRRDCIDEQIRFAEHYPTWEDYWFFCRLSERHDLLFLDCPIAENRGHAGPRLTQLPKAQTLECYLDICEKIYFPSHSANRPPDKIIRKYYGKAKTALFKEYLKNGDRYKARALIGSAKESYGFQVDLTFPLYWLAALLPFDATNHLVKFKRALLGD